MTNTPYDRGYADYFNAQHLNPFDFFDNCGHDWREWVIGYQAARAAEAELAEVLGL